MKHPHLIRVLSGEFVIRMDLIPKGLNETLLSKEYTNGNLMYPKIIGTLKLKNEIDNYKNALINTLSESSKQVQYRSSPPKSRLPLPPVTVQSVRGTTGLIVDWCP